MSSDAFQRALNATHRALLAVTRGRLGWRISNMPILDLKTTGRRTGKRRATMLSSPLERGHAYLIVASRGGDDRHPAWYLNLLEEPDVEVTTQHGTQRMRARVVTSEERAELWPQVTKDHPNYAGYQRKTDREIPLIWLEPLS
jgi:deazaflavin-dependent oxidoreductase (nitroreductase family)